MAIKPSRNLALFLSLSHALVAIVVYLTALPLAARLAMLAPVLLSLSYYLSRDALLLLPGSWHEISFDCDSWSVITRNGSCLSGQAACDTTITPWCIVLRLRLKSHRLPVSRAIFSDALDRDAFRELRVRLKFSQ